MTLRLKFIFGGYIATIIALFFYSFTQVDLSLTLSQASWWQVTQKFFQRIGYFDRPLSALLYLIIILLLFAFYTLFIKLSAKKKITFKNVWILIFISTTILTFSYNAFSYDLFNYIFDAKIVTFYHQSPYLHNALDYMGDPMLSFMRWTHRTYPYGPTWLIFTVPLSYVGLNFFLPTFFIFKIFNSLYFLGTAFLIQKILRKIKGNEIVGLVLFALNPLLLIECLVSSHNDTLMVFLAVLSIYLLFENKRALSIIALISSIGVKFATVFLIPAFAYYFFKDKFKNFSNERFLEFNFFLMFIALIAVTVRTNFQPWYLLYILPFSSLLPSKNYAIGASIILPLFALLEYIPFLYTGNWDSPIPQILLWITIAGLFTYFTQILLSNKIHKLLITRNK